MKKLVIFGTGDIADLAFFYFTNDSQYQVAAFTVDAEYITAKQLHNLPVVTFDSLQELYPPTDYEVFIALSYSKINQVRKDKYLACAAKGYTFANYVSSRATVLTDKIGENCFILEDNTIQPYVTIGNNVTLWSGNHIGHHSNIGDHTFISSHVVVSGGVQIGEQCFIGVNSTLRDHINVGDRCVIGAGVLLLSNAEPDGLYVGSETSRSKVPSNKLKRI